jgi:PKD repeat protein
VKPLPPVEFTYQGACGNSPVSFIPSAGVINMNTIATWLWQFGDGTTSSLSATSHIYNFAGSYAVSLTITDTAGCSNSISHQVTVVPLPQVNFATTAPSCQQTDVDFTDLTNTQSGYITRWTWSFGDGNIQTIIFPNNPAVTHIYTNAGSFVVTLTVKTSDSCTNSISRTINIFAKPTAQFTHGTGCENMAMSFNDQSVSAGASINEWLWNFGDPASGVSNSSTLQNPTHSYAVAGTYTVQLTITTSAGCSDVISQIVTIANPPAVDFTFVVGCSGNATQFTSTTSATTQSWSWNFGDGTHSALASPSHVYNLPGTYAVTLTITDATGCANSITRQVTISSGPAANFIAGIPACSGSPVTFTDLTNANSLTITSWHWNFGDGLDTTYATATANISHTYVNSGTYVVTLTVQTQQGCAGTMQHTITVSPAPSSAFSYANTCLGENVQFNDQSTLNGGSNIANRLWNFGDPASGINNTSILANPTHVYATAGNFVVTLVVTNASGCSNSVQSTIDIHAKPLVEFTNDSITCLGSPVSFFTDITITNVAAIQSFAWNFGDGSPAASQQNVSHAYTVSGTYTVTLSVTDTSGCENTVSHQVVIQALPTASFSFANTCEESITQFTDVSSAPSGESIITWNWDFGILSSNTDTSSLQNPTFVFTNPGTYNVSLTVTTANGCSHTVIIPVQIWGKPTAHFNYSASPCSNGLVQFQDSSYSYQSVITNWQWEFEPNQFGTGFSPTYQYFNLDSCYNVKLIVTNNRGCIDTTTMAVCVPAPLDVTFTYSQACFGNPIHFSPHVNTPIGDSLLAVNWTFGDPASGTSNSSSLYRPVHTFTLPGLYNVILNATDRYGCTATSTLVVDVKALPLASFIYSTGLCDSTVVFTSTSADPSSTITTYIWEFGDGTSATTLAPINTATHKYPATGIYNATLTVINQNGCRDNQSMAIQQSPCLMAAFASNDTLGCQNNILTFTDHSTCSGTIATWHWTWGDGTTSDYTIYQPKTTHTYALPGIYSVSLSVTTIVNGVTITDNTLIQIRVFGSPVANFDKVNACANDEVNFRNTTNSNGAVVLTYDWNFGDTGTSSDSSVLRNPAYNYPAAGVYNAQLIVTNELGCSDTATQLITINSLPSAAYDYSIACVDHETYFFDHSDSATAPIVHWGWRVSDTEQLGWMSGKNTSFTFDTPGIFNVKLTVTDENNCIDTITRRIKVNPAPVSAFSINENYEQIQGQIKLMNGSLSAMQYHWDFGNGSSSVDESPVVMYNEDGDYLIKLETENSFGCTDTASVLYKFMFKGLWVPNAFTPGGPDESIRLFKPVGINLISYSASVYNSHGDLLWSSDKLDSKGSPAEGWDGSYKDHLCQEDVYVWKITAIFRDGSIWMNKDVGNRDYLNDQPYGTVTLIR